MNRRTMLEDTSELPDRVTAGADGLTGDAQLARDGRGPSLLDQR